MAYTKHNWLQRLGTGLNKFKDTISGSIFALVNQPDTVTQAGTPLRADWLNEMEQGIFEAHNIADAAKLKADAALPASSYSASDVLAKLKTVHGAGSGINADLLDGQHASAFATAAQGIKADNALPASSYSASDVLAKLKTVHGAGSGIDADMVDGIHATAFARSDIATFLRSGSSWVSTEGNKAFFNFFSQSSSRLSFLGYASADDVDLSFYSFIGGFNFRTVGGRSVNIDGLPIHPVLQGTTVPSSLKHGQIFVKT